MLTEVKLKNLIKQIISSRRSGECRFCI